MCSLILSTMSFCVVAAWRSSCNGGPISCDGEDGRMDEYESEDAEICVDEKMKEHCDASTFRCQDCGVEE